MSLDLTLVDQVVNPSPSLVDPTILLNIEVEAVDPTLPLKSEVEVVDPSPSLVDPTLPLESEVKVVKSVPFPPDPALSSESVKAEVVSLTKYSSCSSLPGENELKPAEFFMLRSDCSR